MQHPEISVLMSVYNDEKYIEEAIDSILNQSLQDFEFIIIDDASTDQTSQILRLASQNDKRIKVYRNDSNIGLTKSLNKGLGLINSKYVARMDSDDVSMPYRLEKQLEVFKANPNSVLVTSNVDIINEDGIVWHQPRRYASNSQIAWLLVFYNYIGGHSQVMFQRDSVLAVGGYNETYKYSQDYDLWVRLSELGDINLIDDVLLQYRQRVGSITDTKSDEQQNYSLRISQQAIQQLTQKTMSLEQVMLLRSFSIRRFDDIDDLSFINTTLNEIFKAFLTRRMLTQYDEVALILRYWVAESFFKLFLVKLKSNQLIKATVSLTYVARWYNIFKMIGNYTKDRLSRD